MSIMRMETRGESTADVDSRDLWQPYSGCSGEGERPALAAFDFGF